jgi:hypothetical protein
MMGRYKIQKFIAFRFGAHKKHECAGQKCPDFKSMPMYISHCT